MQDWPPENGGRHSNPCRKIWMQMRDAGRIGPRLPPPVQQVISRCLRTAIHYEILWYFSTGFAGTLECFQISWCDMHFRASPVTNCQKAYDLYLRIVSELYKRPTRWQPRTQAFFSSIISEIVLQRAMKCNHHTCPRQKDLPKPTHYDKACAAQQLSSWGMCNFTCNKLFGRKGDAAGSQSGSASTGKLGCQDQAGLLPNGGFIDWHLK